MKLWIVSDLHCDASLWSPAVVPDHNVFVIAGDVSNSPENALVQLYRLAQFTHAPILFVPGNHDYFGDTFDTFDIVDIPGIHVLTPGKQVVIGGVRFVGSTMWTDWLLNDHEFMAQRWAARTMPEYSRVTRADGDLISPKDVSAEHQRHRAAIDEALAVPHDGPTVVVTHHAPSLQSIHPGERTDVASAAFASDLEDIMRRHRPQLWVHGHIHWAVDYRVGDTRVVCNPRGYHSPDWSERTGWREDLVIEV